MATGLGGRIRRSPSSGERARVAVRKAIAAAVARIEAELSEVGRLLRDTVRTGQSCRYDLDPARPGDLAAHASRFLALSMTSSGVKGAFGWWVKQLGAAILRKESPSDAA